LTASVYFSCLADDFGGQGARVLRVPLALEEQAALEAGMQEKAEEFKKSGSKIYEEVGSSGSVESAPAALRAAPKE
jgi:hypothetical protein